VSEVPIIVEADTEEDAKTFVTFLETIERPRIGRRQAAGEKQPVLPASAKPSDEPKKEKIVSDALAPKETTKTVTVTDDKVELDGKSYRLVSIEDDEEEKEKPEAPKAESETAEEPKGEPKDDEKDDKEETADTSKAEELANEVSEDKESKLLLAFTLADQYVELGMCQPETKMVLIADLEEESLESLIAREATLKSVKIAGLGKRQTRVPEGIRRVPRLAHTPVPAPSVNGTMDSVPDEALFL
jgi:hypothetical protein